VCVCYVGSLDTGLPDTGRGDAASRHLLLLLYGLVLACWAQEHDQVSVLTCVDDFPVKFLAEHCSLEAAASALVQR
jgi:hypothetical protein